MTGRYRHLSHLTTPMSDARDSGESRPVSPPASNTIHVRAILFILIALLVGAGLLTLVPDLSASNGSGSKDRQPISASESTSESRSSQPIARPDPHLEAVAVSKGPSQENEGVVSARSISSIFTPEVQHWQPRIAEWSERFNLDPNIIATIMQIESCGDPLAASSAGAQGLFQVMPFHFAPGEDMLDPDTNAGRGLDFYNRQLEYTGQDIYLSFAGYNGGYAASGSSFHHWANETQRYYTWASGIYDDAKAGLLQSPTLQTWLDAGGRGGCQRAAQNLGI
jgi:hypothetical protein